ncbi:hypothetical protein GW17_00045598 [Ensete ventricosum]|nr:hypothetical protein GW17_00045598 [Ensete ventricosum]
MWLVQTKIYAFKQGFPYRAVRPRIARYVPVRQLTGMRTGRYRAVLPKGDCRWSIEGKIDSRRSIEEKSRREEEEEEEKKKEEEETKEKRYLELSSPVCPRRSLDSIVQVISLGDVTVSRIYAPRSTIEEAVSTMDAMAQRTRQTE